ncbi:MAG: hypothetical protein NVS4B11_22250 [Ktedonobacteraceae bacterium]
MWLEVRSLALSFPTSLLSIVIVIVILTLRIAYSQGMMIKLYDAFMSENAIRGKLAELLYPAMTKRNMSVQALASAIDVQRQTCYAWLHEYQRPSLEMLGRLRRVLDIPFADLVAATHSDVESGRLESLVQIYLELPEDRRRLLEDVAVAFAIESKHTLSSS